MITIEKRNHPCNNKSKDPYSEKNSNPYAPSHQCVAVSMFTIPKNPEVKKASHNRCIQHAQHDDSGYRKSISNLFIYRFECTVGRAYCQRPHQSGLPVVYCPSLEYITPPARVNRINSEIVTAQRTLGNSRGSRISAMKDGRVICPLRINTARVRENMRVYVILSMALIPLRAMGKLKLPWSIGHFQFPDAMIYRKFR